MSKGINLKNYIAIKKIYRGYVVYELIDDMGDEFVPFSLFQRELIDNPTSFKSVRKELSASTIKIARTAVAKFLDYLDEMGVNKEDYNSNLLRFIVNLYPEYLACNIDQQNTLLKKADEALKAYKPNLRSKGSQKSHIIYVNNYLDLSEKIARESIELLAVKQGLNPNAAYQSTFTSLWELKSLSQSERKAISASKVGACIRDKGQIMLKTSRTLNVSRQASNVKPITSELDRAFPIDSVEKLLLHVSSKRNRAIFSVLACLGLRISEVLQLRWSDINILEKDIVSIPASKDELIKAKVPLDKILSILSNKGRNTISTMAIGELESLMFRCLYEYQCSSEYKTSPNHDFIFVFSRGIKKGEPLLQILDVENNAVSILLKALKLACKKANISPPNISHYKAYVLHDFRHGYGTYMLNSAPYIVEIIDSYGTREIIEYGFPIADVSKFMGHANVGSTEVYSKKSLSKQKESHIEATAILQAAGCTKTRVIALATYHAKARDQLIASIESPVDRAEVKKLIEDLNHD